MRKKVIAIVLLFLASIGISSKTQAENNPIIYQSYGDIPEILRGGIYKDRYLDDYLRVVMGPLRKLAKDNKALTSKDIERLTNAYTNNIRSEKLSRMVLYDLNFDGVIDKEEVRIQIEKKLRHSHNEEYISNQVNKIFESDVNQDDKISYDEMSILLEGEKEQHRSWREISNAIALQNLDPNKDNILTDKELETLARGAFRVLDLDKDMKTSDDEFKKYREALQKIQQSKKPNYDQIKKFQKFSTAKKIPKTCKFGNDYKAPKNSIIYGVSAEKSKSLDIYIDYTGQVANSVELEINNDKPVILILGAIQPTIWTIRRTQNTKISAIFLTGNYKQILRGVDPAISILKNIVRDEIGKYNHEQPCRNYVFSAQTVKDFKTVSQHLFGKEAFEYISANDEGVVKLGNTNDKNREFITFKNPPIESFEVKGTILSPGVKGLEEAIQKGFIRKATEEDLDSWLDLLETKEKQSPSRNLPQVEGKTLRDLLPRFNFKRRAYVVLDDFIIPSGLNGGNLAIFIVPKGVPSPRGNSGHSSIYDMNTGTCSGPTAKC